MSNLLEQASLVMIPSGYKEDIVYSEIPIDGSGDLQFTRSSNGTRVNSAGLVEDCPWNLLQQSETFENASWGKNNLTVTANTTTAPNGTTTADTFTLTASSDSSVYQAVNGESNNYTTSVYAKYVSGDKYLYFFSPLNSQGAKVWFDIQNGTVSNQLSGFTGTIEDAGNGWYKCSMYNTTAAVLDYLQMGISTTNSSRTLSNNSVSYFWGAQVNLGTAKPYFPTTDRLNVPRLTYQNGGGGCPSLLLEKQSTNLALYSEQFDNANWTKNANVSITANNTTSPDGTQNADKMTNSGASNIQVYQLFSTSTALYTHTIYAKKGTNKYLGISLTSNATASDRYVVYFDLDNGLVHQVFNTATPLTNTSNSIQSVGNGWYRCVISADCNGQVYAVYQCTNNGTLSLATNGDLTNATNGDTYIWGAQAEVSSYPTSYIPTTSSSATRVADAYSRSLSSIASGTAFINITDNVAVETPGTHLYGPFGITGASLGLHLSRPNNARLRLWTQASANVFQTTETNLKLAMTWDGTNVNVYQNGVKMVTNYAYALTNVNNLLSSTNLESSATIAEIVLFNSVLTDAECIALTA